MRNNRKAGCSEDRAKQPSEARRESTAKARTQASSREGLRRITEDDDFIGGLVPEELVDGMQRGMETE